MKKANWKLTFMIFQAKGFHPESKTAMSRAIKNVCDMNFLVRNVWFLNVLAPRRP
jgi:hypothetical protein